jgi:hypothetical protein
VKGSRFWSSQRVGLPASAELLGGGASLAPSYADILRMHCREIPWTKYGYSLPLFPSEEQDSRRCLRGVPHADSQARSRPHFFAT